MAVRLPRATQNTQHRSAQDSRTQSAATSRRVLPERQPAEQFPAKSAWCCRPRLWRATFPNVAWNNRFRILRAAHEQEESSKKQSKYQNGNKEGHLTLGLSVVSSTAMHAPCSQLSLQLIPEALIEKVLKTHHTDRISSHHGNAAKL